MSQTFESVKLVAKKEISIRFSEVDVMGVVWHGNYLKFFEDGREAFGQKFDLDFVRLYHDHGYTTPIVHLNLDYKKPVKLTDYVVVDTVFVPCDAAKIIFDYYIYNRNKNELVTRGRSIQVFLKGEELSITVPDFFLEWKKKWLNA